MLTRLSRYCVTYPLIFDEETGAQMETYHSHLVFDRNYHTRLFESVDVISFLLVLRISLDVD